MPKELTHVDLFSGIAGFALAAKWAGFKTVAFCERDAWCQKVIKMALPTVLADLEREGFRASVFLLPAHGVGAPHRRRRAWVVAESLHPDSDSFRPHREEVH